LETTKNLKDEMKQRMQEQRDYFNTEEAGYLEVDEANDLERTFKVKQDDIKGLVGI